jgi:polar amino acid transport system substrate-binding protein
MPKHSTSGATGKSWIALLLCTLMLFSPAVVAQELPQCSRTFTLAYHEHGLLYNKTIDKGIDKDVAAELVKRSGCQVEISTLPRSRIWLMIEAGQLDFSMSGITNEARDKYASFAWYLYNKYYFLVRQDAGVTSLQEFERNPLLKLGGIRSFRYSKNLNSMVDRLAPLQRITEVADHEQLLNMLRLGRIQGMIIEPFNYSQVESRELDRLTTILESGDPPTLHGLIMSKKSLPLVEQKKWRAIIDGMRLDGTMLKILQNYFDPAMAKSMVTF